GVTGPSQPSPAGRMPPRRADQLGMPGHGAAIGDTAVVTPSVLPMAESGAVEKAIDPFGGHIDRLLDRSILVTLPARGRLREQAAQIARCALALRVKLPDAPMAIATGRAALLAKLPVGPLVDQAAALIENEKGGVVR